MARDSRCLGYEIQRAGRRAALGARKGILDRALRFSLGASTPPPIGKDHAQIGAERICKRQLQCHAEVEDSRPTLNGDSFGAQLAESINGPAVLDDRFDCAAFCVSTSSLQLFRPRRAAVLSP